MTATPTPRFIAPPPTDADRPIRRKDRTPTTRMHGDVHEKLCTTCRKWLPLTKKFFQWTSPNPSVEKMRRRASQKSYYRIQKDHWSADCKACRKIKYYAHIAHKRKMSPLVTKWHNVCASARNRGIHFIRECPWSPGEVPTVCPVLGIPLTYPGKVGDNPGFARRTGYRQPRSAHKGHAHDTCISADRVSSDPAIGYVKANVVWVSYRANRIKNDATPEESLRVAAYSYRESFKRGLVPSDPIQDLVEAAEGSTDPAIMAALDAFKKVTAPYSRETAVHATDKMEGTPAAMG